MADPPPERKPEGQSHDAHNATGGFGDDGMWATVKVLLDGIPEGEEHESRQLATLPMMGGLGLRFAVRCAPAAYWASWSDALHMITQRTPDVAGEVVRRLSNEEPLEGCLGELRAASSHRILVETFLGRARANALRIQRHVNPVNGPTVGSIGLLPSSTLTLGRTRC